jgi:hypothetical protein
LFNQLIHVFAFEYRQIDSTANKMDSRSGLNAGLRYRLHAAPTAVPCRLS